MPGILEQLPRPDDLKSLVKFDGLLPLDKLQGLRDTVSSMTGSVGSIKSDTSFGGFSIDSLPSSLSANGILSSVGQPLGKLKAISPATVAGDLSPTNLPVSLPKPQDAGLGGLNGVISNITSAIIPAPKVTPPDAPNADILAVDTTAMADALRRLGQASADTPLKLLSATIKIADGFIGQVTDTNNLKLIVVQSLEEIYSQQVLRLKSMLPLFSVENSIRLLGAADSPSNFVTSYKLLLDEIDILDPKDTDRLKSILGDGRNQFSPTLLAFAQANATLAALKANDTSALASAMGNVLDFTGSGDVLLQKYFDAIADQLTKLLSALTPPVQTLGDMAGSVADYLNQAGDAAEKTAQTVADQIKTNLAQAEDFLKEVQKTIQDIQAQIASFIDGIKDKIAPVVDKIKSAIANVGAEVQKLFLKLEELKQQLNQAVADLKGRADKELTDFFNQLEAKIRQLLDQITGVLDRPEVKDALNQAKQGIEKFKTTVEQASLKPVFDLVISKTGEIETKVKGIDVSKMGTPQKAALKVGAKVIEQVKVDEILKPELQAAFEQIKAPLADLIKLLKDKALELENIIDSFQPGTLIAGYVNPPLDNLLKTIDQFRPSKLLAPLKEANAKLTEIVEELNPDLLINQAQAIYQKIGDTLKVLDPTPLNQLVGDAVDVAVSQLGKIRDHDIDALLNMVQSAISLESLMAKTGIAEIANADFWDKLRYYLGGSVLDVVTTAVDQVGQTLTDQIGTVDFSAPVALLQNTITSLENQLKTDAVLMGKRFGELAALLPADTVNQFKALEDRRVALQGKPSNPPEIGLLLADLSLAPVLSLAAYAPPPSLADALGAINGVVTAPLDAVRQLTQSDFQKGALAIFQKQISDPFHGLIEKLKTALTPFKTAIDKIQAILTTLIALPPKIDAAVAKVLAAARDSVKQLITTTIGDIQTFQTALADTLKSIYAAIQDTVAQFSPYWLLNSFGEGDFARRDGDDATTPGGMLAMARRIASGRDTGPVPIAALAQTKLTQDQQAVLQGEVAGTSLSAGNHLNVITAMNGLLREGKLCSRDNVDGVKGRLNTDIQKLQGNQSRTPQETETLYRLTALLRQVSDAWVSFMNGPDKNSALMRLNRIIIEAAYPDDIGLSIQSIHPLLVQNVAHLYPDDTVALLDDIFTGCLDKVRGLPDKLIKAPLDDAFNKIDAIFKSTFDISGIFTVLQIKLDGIDDDMKQGLDRLSIAYNELLTTFDQRLSAA